MKIGTANSAACPSMSPGAASTRARAISALLNAITSTRGGTKLNTSAKSVETRSGGPRPVARLGTIELLTAPWIVVTLTLLAGKCLSACR